MRKLLYFIIIIICIVSIYMIKDRVCIRCIEREDDVCLTTSSKTISDFIYNYTDCDKCKQENNN